MKHIYIVDEHQSSKQNGIGTYIRQLLKCFEDTDNDVNLLSFNSDKKEFMIEKAVSYTEYHIPVCGIGGFLDKGELMLPILRLYINDSEENVFFINHFPCDRFLSAIKRLFPLSITIFVIHDQGWCAPLLGDVKKFRKILTSKYYPSKDKQEWRNIHKMTSRERRMYHIVDKIVALSTTTYELLPDLYGVSTDKVHLIPNGLQKPRQIGIEESGLIRRNYGIAEDEIVLLYTGRTSPSKGIIPLLLAFDQLWKANPKLHLVIAGEIFNFNDFVRCTPDSASHITYTGLLSKERLSDWYRIADIGILPSFTEQSSYTGIEMLAYGKLIVTTDGHNLTDMFNDEVAILAHVGNKRIVESTEFVASLVKAINRALLLEPDERCRLQRTAFRYYNKFYSFQNWKATYIRLING